MQVNAEAQTLLILICLPMQLAMAYTSHYSQRCLMEYIFMHCLARQPSTVHQHAWQMARLATRASANRWHAANMQCPNLRKVAVIVVQASQGPVAEPVRLCLLRATGEHVQVAQVGCQCIHTLL